ncbi:MAG: hypothetical protein NZ551_01135 [Microscillaceae bacterium]|nr:hypothetical protein [Microscillaceae bacterium]MDW8459793.1 hypothetical protein [Cytophagales bacterium]
MAYKQYSAKKIKNNLGIDFKQIGLFDYQTIPNVEPSAWLIENLKVSKQMALTTEKAVCEYLISPILTEIQLRNTGIVLFSGEQLNVDKSLGLNGEIDFLFAKTTNFLEIESPILCITEAKIGLIDKGIPQATAQMYAVRLFNEKEGNPIETAYGAVTDGKTWRFLKLEKQTLYTDIEILYLDNLTRLLGTLQYIIDFYKEN